jgi:hypothetical protein
MAAVRAPVAATVPDGWISPQCSKCGSHWSHPGRYQFQAPDFLIIVDMGVTSRMAEPTAITY